jgi:hypothetical protein
MADFSPKSEANVAKSGEGKAAAGQRNDEHEAPPVMHLEAHHIKKLFGNKMPPIGSKVKVNGLVHVGAYNEDHAGPPSGGKAGYASEDNPGRSMTLHFHKMDMGTDQQSSDADRESQTANGAKAEMDKALARQSGGKKKQLKGVKSRGETGEGQEGTEGRNDKDNAPRGSNGPSGRA